METFESIVEIKHGSTVLVELGDPMWTPVAINGQQIVDVVARVRAVGIEAIPRGNERNTVTFERCDETDDIATAFKNEMAWAAALPRTKATVTITFADTSSFTLANATVESWSGGQMDRLGRQGLTLIGGKITQVSLEPSPSPPPLPSPPVTVDLTPTPPPVDITAPALTLATASATSPTTAASSVTTNEAGGTLWAYLSTSATAPSTATLKASGSPQTITTTGAKTTNFTGLTASTAYYIYAIHSDASGNDSNITTATLTTPAVSSGTASLALTWEDNSAIEDGYRLRYRTAGSGSYTLATTTAANATSGTITGLAFATNYDVTVAAFNASGEYSVVGPVTRYTPPEFAPTSLSATATLSTSITVGFTAAAGVTSYQGYYRATGSSTWLTGSAITSGTAITFTGLASLTAYQFMVRGYLENTAPQTPSYSPDSATVSATTIASGVFTGYDNQQFTTGSAPAGYSFVEYGGTTPTITWGEISTSPAFVARSNEYSCRVVAPTHTAANEAHYSFEALVNSPSGYTPLVYVPGIASVIMGATYLRILTWSEDTGYGGGSGTTEAQTPTTEFSSFGVTRTYWIDYIKGTGAGDTLFRISWSTTGIKPTSYTTANSLTYMSSIAAQATGLVFHVAPTAETAATYINGSIYSL